MAKKASKRYRSGAEKVDALATYPLDKAIEVLGAFPQAKFDETVELSVNLGVDPRQSSQMVRGTVNLPNGSGKKVVVAAFTNDPEAAQAAGADHVGLEDLVAKVKDGWMDFDVAVATPDAMKLVRTVARVLGPRGLMPNPKTGTVSDDIAAAIKEVKGGRVEFKMDKTANMAVVVGKRSFSADQLAENAKAAIEKIGAARPGEFKGRFIKAMSVSSTMSPGVKLESAVFSQF